MKKRDVVILAVIITAILIIILIKNKPAPVTSKEIAQCIGEKSELYVQLGCPACENQEKLFGENYIYLNSIDCFFEGSKCGNIESTPTWIIKGKKYVGVQDVETLQQLTGC